MFSRVVSRSASLAVTIPPILMKSAHLPAGPGPSVPRRSGVTQEPGKAARARTMVTAFSAGWSAFELRSVYKSNTVINGVGDETDSTTNKSTMDNVDLGDFDFSLFYYSSWEKNCLNYVISQGKNKK